jgi:hypothetical protein
MSKSMVTGWPGTGDAGVITRFVMVAVPPKTAAGISASEAIKTNKPISALRENRLNFFIATPLFTKIISISYPPAA